eukprot:GHVS01001401.1.p2 GENE.GHVS01001401.1~~GHVS01001401.1.p2  ORF type:complete len:123 (+),score=12.13 GHVS01001401.1:789-1157(+)
MSVHCLVVVVVKMLTQARNSEGTQWDANLFSVLCDHPRDAEEELRVMLQTDQRLKELLKQDETTVHEQPSGPVKAPTGAHAKGDEAIAPNTSAPAQPPVGVHGKGKSKGRPGKGKGKASGSN